MVLSHLKIVAVTAMVVTQPRFEVPDDPHMVAETDSIKTKNAKATPKVPLQPLNFTNSIF